MYSVIEEASGYAKEYMRDKQFLFVPVPICKKLDIDFSKSLADAYDNVQHTPHSPFVNKSYRELKRETLDQFQFLCSKGINFMPWKNSGQPYGGSKELFQDIRDNNRIYIFLTHAAEGDSGEFYPEHPLLEFSGIEIDGVSLTYNDLFRGVHDYFGHAKGCFSFSALGEENAWRQHSSMYSAVAKYAMTTETRGQNSWVNFGPHMRNKDGDLLCKENAGYLVPSQRPFAPQKAGVMPASFVFYMKG